MKSTEHHGNEYTANEPDGQLFVLSHVPAGFRWICSIQSIALVFKAPAKLITCRSQSGGCWSDWRMRWPLCHFRGIRQREADVINHRRRIVPLHISRARTGSLPQKERLPVANNSSPISGHLQILRLLPVLHGEALATLPATARENLPAIGCLAALQKSVLSEPLTPLELIQHSRQSLQKVALSVKGKRMPHSSSFSGLPLHF